MLSPAAFYAEIEAQKNNLLEIRAGRDKKCLPLLSARPRNVFHFVSARPEVFFTFVNPRQVVGHAELESQACRTPLNFTDVTQLQASENPMNSSSAPRARTAQPMNSSSDAQPQAQKSALVLNWSSDAQGGQPEPV